MLSECTIINQKPLEHLIEHARPQQLNQVKLIHCSAF